MEYGINSTTNWFKPMRLGQFYGVASFSIEGIGLILPIRASMQDYKSFRWLFHLIGGLIVAWYFFFGMSGAMVDCFHSSGSEIKCRASFCSATPRYSGWSMC